MDMLEAAQAVKIELTVLKTKFPGQTEPAYFKPLSLAESDRLARFIKLEGGDDASDGDRVALTFIDRIVDATGKKIFKPSHKTMLLEKIPLHFLVDSVNEISSSVPTIEEAEKN
jgi:hypothetical protein